MLTDIYSKYLETKARPFDQQKLWDKIPAGRQKYKVQILDMLDKATTDKDSDRLRFCIAAISRDGLDKDYSDRFYKIILETWHGEHEDIVDIIGEFKEDRFSEALFKIALDSPTYRKFDDENESTLRKCVHALKAMNSPTAKERLTKLMETKNKNVQIILDMYG